MSDFLLFYGADCPTCQEIRLQVAQLSFTRGFSYQEYEVWNNEQNKQLFDETVDQSIDAVPVIHNVKTGNTWYGQTDLSDWLVL